MRPPMRDDGRPGLPRLGPTVKGAMAILFVASLVATIVATWAPGPPDGERAFLALTAVVDKVLAGQVWRLLTAGVLTAPASLSHVLFSMVGLFFLAPDLERRWGSGRLARFLVLSNVLGLGLGVLVAAQPYGPAVFHPPVLFGPSAALTAVAMAWSRENAGAQVRLFFVVPVSGRALGWVTVGFCVLGVLYQGGIPEGVISPFGGVLAGVLFAGAPSPARTAWLKLRLAFLRRRSQTLTVDDVLGSGGRGAKPPKAAGGSAPRLRVVRGGADEDLTKRKPPKDKRFLN